MRDPELAGAPLASSAGLCGGAWGGQRNRPTALLLLLGGTRLGSAGHLALLCLSSHATLADRPRHAVISRCTYGTDQAMQRFALCWTTCPRSRERTRKRLAARISSARGAWALIVLHGEKSMNTQGPCPSRHHHTTPDQVHETCSSHVECASCDWSPGRDKTQEATSLTTALVLAGNDRIFCPHQPHQSSGGRARGGQTSRRAQCACHASSVRQSRMQTTPSSKAIATATVTASPIALLVNDTARGVLFASLSHTPTPTPPPPRAPLGRSLRTIAASGCRKTTQCASPKQGRSFICKGEGMVHSSNGHGDGDGDSFSGGYAVGDGGATRGFGMIENALESHTSEVGIKNAVSQGHIALQPCQLTVPLPCHILKRGRPVIIV